MTELENKLQSEVGKEIKINDSLGYGEDLSTDYTVKLDYVSRLKLGFSIKIGGEYLNQVKDEFVKAQYLREKPSIQGFPAGRMPPLVVLLDHYMNKFKKGYYKTMNNLFDFVLLTEIRRAMDFVKDHYKLENALDPQFDHLDVRNGVGETEKTSYKFEDYNFKCSVEVLPSLPTLDFTKLSIETPHAKISDADVKKAMQEWADNNFHGVPLSILRPVQGGDTVVVDLQIPGKKEALDNFKVVVGHGKLNPEFEHNLIGKNIGDRFEYNFGLPKDFADPSVAGRSFNIAVNVKDIQTTESYKIDEEMAMVFECKTVAECEEKFKNSLEERAEKLALIAAKNNIEKVLGESFSIDLPQSIIDDAMLKRCDRLAKELAMNLHYPMPDDEKEAIKDKMLERFGYDFDKWQAIELPSVESDVKAMLQIVEYTKANNMKVLSHEIDAKLAQYSVGFKGGLKEAMQHFEQNPQIQQNLAREVLEEKVLKAILKDVKTKEVNVTLEELSEIVAKANRVNLIENKKDKPAKKIKEASSEESKPAKKSVEKTE